MALRSGRFSPVLVSAVVLAVLLAGLPTVSAQHRFGINCTSLADCEPRYVCIHGTCSNCETDAHCGKSDIVCVGEHSNKLQEVNKVCKHKGLFPFNWVSDGWGTVIGVFGSVLAAGAGTGGGGLFVPVFVLLMHFTTKEAIPLSHAMIFGGAIANLIFNSREKHPKANRPLINMDITLIMEPLTLAGTVIGVFVNVVSPEWLIVALLTVILSFTCWRTAQKTLKTYREETQEASLLASINHDDESEPVVKSGSGKGAAKRSPSKRGTESLQALGLEGESGSENDNVSVESPLLMRTESGIQIPGISISAPDPKEAGGLLSFSGLEDNDTHDLEPLDDTFEDDEEGGITLEKVMERESRFNFKKLVLLFVSWLGLLIISLLKGGEGAPSMIDIEGCSAAYWWLVVSIFPFLGVITWLAAIWLRHEERQKAKVGFVYLPGDPRWTTKVMVKYSLLCAFAGIFAGMLGIGGGMIKGPLLLELGIDPQTTAATAAFMILFTSAATTFQFSFLGLLPTDYGLFFGLVGFVFCYVGQVAVTSAVKKYKKTSLILLLITLVLAISTILLAFAGIRNVVTDLKTGRHIHFTGVCDED